jgi:hypothetical protein
VSTTRGIGAGGGRRGSVSVQRIAIDLLQSDWRLVVQSASIGALTIMLLLLLLLCGRGGRCRRRVGGWIARTIESQ